MLSYLNEADRKQFYLNRVRKHREADEIVQRVGWQSKSLKSLGEYTKGRGCAVGCTLETYDHSLYPSLLGIPMEIAFLQDCIFENLQESEALAFPEQFLSAIPVGADLALVWPWFALELLTNAEYGVLRHIVDPAFSVQKTAIETVTQLCRNWVDTGVKPSLGEWGTAETAARMAWMAVAEVAEVAAQAAWTAAQMARAAQAATAQAAWLAAFWQFARAAQAATAQAAWLAAFWQFARDLLLRLLAEAPIPAT